MDETATTSPSASPGPGFRAGQVLNQRYRIERKLGAGGMGVVFLAVDVKLERQVAIKTIRRSSLGRSPQQAAVARGRFEREGRLVARLSHPNLAAVFDVGESDGGSYLVMEYVDGTTLRDELAAKGRLDLAAAVAVFRGVLAGLEEAQRRQIVHRDSQAGQHHD